MVFYNFSDSIPNLFNFPIIALYACALCVGGGKLSVYQSYMTVSYDSYETISPLYPLLWLSLRYHIQTNKYMADMM